MSQSIKPGTIVRTNSGSMIVRRGSPAIALSSYESGKDTGVTVLTDCGIKEGLRGQIRVPRNPILEEFRPMRLYMPYGVWAEDDGSKVLFSRDYCPLWRISLDGKVSPEEPWRWINYVIRSNLWDPAHPPWLSRATERRVKEYMADLGVTGVPKLMGVIAGLLGDPGLEITDAVGLMAPPEKVGQFARKGLPHLAI